MSHLTHLSSHQSIGSRRPEELRRLLNESANPRLMIDRTEEGGRNLIHWLACHNLFQHIKVIVDFLKKYDLLACLETVDAVGNTALHLATNDGGIETVNCLLEELDYSKKLKLLLITNDHSKHRQTVINKCLDESGSDTVIWCMLKHLKPPDLLLLLNSLDNTGESAIHKMVKKAQYNSLITDKVLPELSTLTAQENLHWVEKRSINRNENVLHLCSRNGQADIIAQILAMLDKLEDSTWLEVMMLKNIDQLTALELAISEHQVKCVEAILSSSHHKTNQLAEKVTKKFTASFDELCRDKNDVVCPTTICSFIKAVGSSQRVLWINKQAAHDSGTFLEKVVEFQWLEVLTVLDSNLEESEKNLLVSEKLASDETIVHKAAANGNPELVSLLLQLAENPSNLILQPNASQKNALHIATENNNSATLAIFLNAIQPDKLVSAINKLDKDSKTVLQLAVEDEAKIECVKHLLNSVDASSMQKIICLKSSHQTVMHIIVKNGHSSTMSVILQIFVARELLWTDITKLLLKKNHHGYTAFHVAASINAFDVFQQVNNVLGEKHRCNLMDLFLSPDELNRESPLHMAAKKGYTQSLNIMLDAAESSLVLLKLLSTLSYTHGSTPSQSDVKSGDSIIVRHILTKLSQDHKTQLLTVPNNINKKTMLHEAFYRYDVEMSRMLLQCVDIEQRFKVCQIKDGKGNSPLHSLRYLTDQASEWSSVIQLLQDLSSDQRMQLVSSKDSDHCTVIQAPFGSNGTVIFNAMLEGLEKKEKLELFGVPDKKGKSVEVLAIHHLRQDSNTLCERISLLAYLVELHPNHTAYPDLLNELAAQVSQENYDQNTLLDQDDNGDTILHIAARLNNYDLVKAILSVSDEEVRSRSIELKNKYKKTPHQLAWSSEKIQGLLSWAKNQKGYYYFPTAPIVSIIYITEDREGAESEKEAFQKTMNDQFQIEARIHRDLTREKIFEEILEAIKPDDISGFVLAFMGHGDKGCVLAKDDMKLSINDILLQMKNPKLDDKPKILIIQACQMHKKQLLAHSSVDPRPPQLLSDRGVAHFDLPGPDFAVLSATINGHFAYRGVFIPTLARNLQNSEQNDDLYEVFLKTTEMMKGSEFEQTPEFRSTMNKRLALRNIFKSSDKVPRSHRCAVQ